MEIFNEYSKKLTWHFLHHLTVTQNQNNIIENYEMIKCLS